MVREFQLTGSFDLSESTARRGSRAKCPKFGGLIAKDAKRVMMAPKSESPTQPEPTQTRPRHCHTRPSGPAPCGGVLCSRWAGVLPRRRLLPSHALTGTPFLLFVVLFLQWQNHAPPPFFPLLDWNPAPRTRTRILWKQFFVRAAPLHISHPHPRPFRPNGDGLKRAAWGTHSHRVYCVRRRFNSIVCERKCAFFG